MGRKKKEIKQEEFIPSHYQQAIFDFIQNGNGNLVVEASAGSGKSSTLIKALDLIPNDKTVLFCAFNTDIVKELKKKIGKRENIELCTVHSLGFSMIKRNMKLESEVPTENKYRSHIFNNIKEYTSINTFNLGRNKFVKYLSNINKLVEYGRNNLSQSKKDLMELVYRHDLDIIADEIEVALSVMEWGKTNNECVDYTDMVWLPNALYMKPYGMQYDYIFVDEAQDLSVAQRELILKCQKINTRYIYVGDSNQSIYSFASASPESFKKIKSIPNTTSLPLSISYRCAKNIVKFAQTYVPSIEPKEDAIDGEVKYNCLMEEVEDGDMVLCRNNAPLMQVYNMFIKMGKKCFIKGKDIGKNLITLLDSVNMEELNVSLRKDGAFIRLYDELFTARDLIMNREGLSYEDAMLSQFITNRIDMIKTLEVLSDGINTTKELKERIKGIFVDKKGEGISLSTIHKAKGLEADNVYIACPSLLPNKNVKQDWEKEQEQNLIYVAYTRAKNKLGFLKEDEFQQFMTSSPIYSDNLKIIEGKVNYILGKTHGTITAPKKEIAKTILTNNIRIDIPKRGVSKVINTQPKSFKNNSYGLNTMMKHKIKKIKI